MKNKIRIIYNKIHDMISRLSSNNFLFIMLFFIVLLASFKIAVFDFLAIFLLFFIVLFLKPEDILYTYVFLFFFEPVTEISLIGGSINRIVLVLGMLKVLYYTYKEKVELKKESMLITLFLSLFLLFSVIINYGNYMENFVLYINIMFFVIYANYLSSKAINQKKKIIDKILLTIVCGVFFSIVHGLLFGNFEVERRVGFNNWRFSGTNDPNFLAYYINLAVIVQIFRKKSKTKKDKMMNITINTFLLAGLILTKSITGIFINTVSFIVLLFVKYQKNIKQYIKKEKKKAIVMCSLLTVVLVFGVFVLIKYSINGIYKDINGNMVANNRISDIVLSIKKGDIDRLTSQKTRDWRLFIDDFKNSEVLLQIFGKGMQPYLIYSDYWVHEVSSHSTYIDFLCCYGIVGMTIIMTYIIVKIKKGIILLSPINNKVYKYVQIILLIYALELSIYTNRVFLVMFLL